MAAGALNSASLEAFGPNAEVRAARAARPVVAEAAAVEAATIAAPCAPHFRLVRAKLR